MTDKISSRRRDASSVVGFVNFPIDTIPNTKEGGIFVRLVVIDTPASENWSAKWLPCAGGDNYFLYDETFLGDDRDATPSKESAHFLNDKCEEKYFPAIAHGSNEWQISIEKYLSRSFLLVMTIGATGWSTNRWLCTFDDLTEEGKNLYKQLQVLYPKCEIRLLTFLDT